MILEDLKQEPLTDPSALIGMRDSIFAADLFIAAVAYWDFFTLLGQNPCSFQEIIELLGIKKRPGDVMITLFKAMGLVEEKRGKLTLTALAREHLVKDSPFYLGSYLASLKGRPVCKAMAEVLKTGDPAQWGADETQENWVKAMENEEFARMFSAGMDGRAAFLAPALAKSLPLAGFSRLLDIGGATGLYAACLVSRHKQLRAAIWEKPPVDLVARFAVKQRGLEEKISVLAGDMFQEDFPREYDVHLFSNVLHDWSEEQVKLLLAKSYQSLAPGGMVIIHDAHLDEKKDGPLAVAEYSVLLMFSTRGKCYSRGEMAGFLAGAGFSGFKVTPTVAGRSAITAYKR